MSQWLHQTGPHEKVKNNQPVNSEACKQVHVSHLRFVGLNFIVWFQSCYLTWCRLNFQIQKWHQGRRMLLLLLFFGVSFLRNKSVSTFWHNGYLWLPPFSLNSVMLDLFVGTCSVWHKYNRLPRAESDNKRQREQNDNWLLLQLLYVG